MQMPSKANGRNPAGLKDNSCLLTPPLARPCQPVAPRSAVIDIPERRGSAFSTGINAEVITSVRAKASSAFSL